MRCCPSAVGGIAARGEERELLDAGGEREMRRKVVRKDLLQFGISLHPHRLSDKQAVYFALPFTFGTASAYTASSLLLLLLVVSWIHTNFRFHLIS